MRNRVPARIIAGQWTVLMMMAMPLSTQRQAPRLSCDEYQ
jgi:hypothetical protein